MIRPWHVSNPERLEALDVLLTSSFSGLHALVDEEIVAIIGTYHLTENDVPIDEFLIRVDLPPTYPMGIPVAREVGGKIPHDEDHHVNANGTLCVGLPEEMWIRYRGRLEVADYLSGPLRDYFIGASAKLRGLPWPFGEWGHGQQGLREYYGQFIDSDDHERIANFVRLIAEGRVKGHVPCPCGSGKESRRCHLQKMRGLSDKLPKEIAMRALQILSGGTDIKK